MKLPKALTPLAERNFRYLWTGQAVSAMGDALTPVALAFATLKIAHSASALGLVLAAFAEEAFWAAITAIPRGQWEAARSTGLTAWQTAFSVVLPQAVHNVLAPLAGNTLELIKTTSIATVVALPELLRSARVAQESTYNPTPLTAAALIYFVLLWPLTRLVARLERKMVASH